MNAVLYDPSVSKPVLHLQPFFSGLDWGKLELKEIKPPEEFNVDNDEDLRHFHDE